MSQSPYQKIPGRGLTWTGFSRVWLAADHVLLVRGQTWTETYRRFFFPDIQAVIVRRTHTGKIWNAVWGGSAAFFLVIALMLSGTAALVVTGLAAPFVVALLINLMLGPTCACHIRTAVQMERLGALNRVRAAQKFITRVEPFIMAAQPESPAPASPLNLPPVLDA